MTRSVEAGGAHLFDVDDILRIFGSGIDDFGAARDLQGLLSVGVTHVLNCAALQCPTFYPQVRACGSRRPVLVCACPRPRPRSIQAVLSSPTSRARWSALLPCRLRRSGPR